MKNIMIYLVILLSILNASKVEFIDPYKMVDYFVLKNGMQVYLLSDKKATNTNISVTVNVGWDIENDSDYGLSHLVEHMVFRDQRVPYHDYLDYMKEEGATYVNGYTSRYKTKLIAKIDSNKSYWITKIFAQMIFDKNVTAEDIDIEKGAVQVEIGEEEWFDKVKQVVEIIGKLSPPNDSIYMNHFGLTKAKELPSSTVEKKNNQNFTMHQVMKHYEEYYYPSNMILKVTGNFDEVKMKKLIQEYYAFIQKTGTKKTYKPLRNAALNGKAYYKYTEGRDNRGYIGTKYLFDECQKHIILTSFMEYVATKIQQKLRNKDGKSYSISSYNFNHRGAGVVSIAFDGLHDDFKNNIQIVRDTLKYYVENIDDASINEALTEYKKRYTSIEFDSNSLTDLVDNVEHMRTDHNISNKTHFDFFYTITSESFKKIVLETFIEENGYTVIDRDYYYFSNDVAIYNLLLFLLLVYLYFKYTHLLFLKKGKSYKKREIIFSSRLSNRFVGFVIFLITFLISTLLYSWLVYLSMKYIMGDSQYLHTINVPKSYYLNILTIILSILCFFITYRVFIRYISSLDVTQDQLYILGSKPESINKENIRKVEVQAWSIDKYFKIKGFSFFFWKSLVIIETKDNKIYYLRAANAKELKEDLLLKWLDL